MLQREDRRVRQKLWSERCGWWVLLAGVGVSSLAVTAGLSAAPPDPDGPAETARQAESQDGEGFSADEREARRPDSQELQSPLLRGLKQTIGDLDAFEESGTAGALTRQLEQADQELSLIRQQNRLALKSINRQSRVGRARQSPNLLLITIDRLGWRELGCYGQEQIRTPRIDELAQQGMRLNRFYAGSADAQAARWTLLTGLNTGHAPADRSDRYRIHGADQTMAEWLWEAGYVTACFGLWPNGDQPTLHGFEHWSGFRTEAEIGGGYPETIHVDGAEFRVLENRDGARQVSVNRLFASELHSWFEHVRTQRRQFFAHVMLNTISRVAAEDGGREETAEERREIVERTDQLVGQLLDVLRAAGLVDRTCVVVTAESGPAPTESKIVQTFNLTGELRLAEHGLAEGNLRVPMVVRWPKYVAAGTVSDYSAVTCDLVPTLCELAIAQHRPQRTDGISLVPLLVGRDQPEHPLLYWETTAGQKGQIARMGAWKCVRLPGSRVISLYNLDDDPAEAINVADRHPEVLKQLTR
ncbi:sulfatase-like hydrolase/transferase [bacterium]|nr:sulfatase-like hydrolase/transferase [bacterium]